jgi:hypothetical protein
MSSAKWGVSNVVAQRTASRQEVESLLEHVGGQIVVSGLEFSGAFPSGREKREYSESSRSTHSPPKRRSGLDGEMIQRHVIDGAGHRIKVR